MSDKLPLHRKTLERRIARLGRLFDLDAIAAQQSSAAAIAEHYANCFGTYRRRHSREGALHLGLSAGTRHEESDFKGHAERLLAAWQGQPAGDILELGFGHGYNLGVLAPRLPASRLAGVDLTPAHVAQVHAMLSERGIANVDARQADFHALPWPDASFDQVYSIEAFCHALDLGVALAEVVRVLRPGGKLTLIDGYLTRRPEAMRPEEATAALLAAKGMALSAIQVESDLLEAAAVAGLSLKARTVLDTQVQPNVRHFERGVRLFVTWPWLGRRLLARMNPLVMRNMLAGYLMGPAMDAGIWGYRELVLEKPALVPG
jgi:SAM-dependent methyltransferase